MALYQSTPSFAAGGERRHVVVAIEADGAKQRRRDRVVADRRGRRVVVRIARPVEVDLHLAAEQVGVLAQRRDRVFIGFVELGRGLAGERLVVGQGTGLVGTDEVVEQPSTGRSTLR